MKKILLFTCLFSYTLTQAQVSLVKDINPGAGDGVGDEIITINNKVLFAGNDGVNGSELWISDGLTYNTNKYLASNNPYMQPRNLYNYSSQNLIAMSAELVSYGNELWLSDASGNNLNTGDFNTSGDSDPYNYGQFGGFLVFSVMTTSNGRELAFVQPFGSTTLIEDINVGAGSSNPSEITQLSNKFYFSADDGVNGRELWSSASINPNSPSLFIDINSGSQSSNPSNFTLFNNKLYFTADDGINGRELWVIDGTASGTQMVMDLYSGSTGSNPENLTVFNNLLCFTATHPTLGIELFKMTTLEAVFNVKNIASGGNSSNPSNLHVYNGTLYFSADDGTNGIELWSTTGFSSTTNLLKDINTNGANPDSNPKGFTEYNGKLYFSADDGTNGTELWVTDGTNGGTVMVDNINPSGNSNPTDLIVANNLLFFAADNGTTGNELWKYQDPSLSINNLELENSISLFPNPTSNLFFIETKYQINNISVFDIQGKTVKSFKENLAFYDIEDLTSGLYFVTIKTEQGKITKKLIKE